MVSVPNANSVVGGTVLYGPDGNPLDAAQSDGGTHPLQVVLVGPGGTRMDGSSGQSDNHTGSRTLMTHPNLFNGTGFDRQRGASVFKTVAFASTGDNSIWTPAGGKKFRLMGYRLSLTANANLAAGAVVTCQFKDGAGVSLGLAESIFIPTAAGALIGSVEVGWFIMAGNGLLSGAADRVLIINLTAALAGGTFRVNVWGTEE